MIIKFYTMTVAIHFNYRAISILMRMDLGLWPQLTWLSTEDKIQVRYSRWKLWIKPSINLYISVPGPGCCHSFNFSLKHSPSAIALSKLWKEHGANFVASTVCDYSQPPRPTPFYAQGLRFSFKIACPIYSSSMQWRCINNLPRPYCRKWLCVHLYQSWWHHQRHCRWRHWASLSLWIFHWSDISRYSYFLAHALTR